MIDSGVNPGDISVEEDFTLANGQVVRPDIAVYQGGKLQQLIEVKGGLASGTRLLEQASNYAQLRDEYGAPVVYKLFNSGSTAFLRFLSEKVHIPLME